MRGSLSYYDLMHTLNQEDREVLNKIIKENIELTKESKMPFL